MISGKKIFITGGAGFLGKNIIKRYYDKNEIVVYSRDEAKHYYLKKEFPNIECVVGDVRNFDLMKRASKGCNIGIFAASLKQIESVDQNPDESVEIIIKGAINSRRCAEENEFESACFISSDKSRAATTLYGSMKFVAGELFIVNAEKSNTRLSTAIYGNVLNSTGSIIPLMWDSINKKYDLTLYSKEMTRFMITVEEAIDVIEEGLKRTGVNIIPNIKSFKVSDLFEIFSDEFGLTYKSGTPRISEKIHEIMIAPEEIPRTYYDSNSDVYIMNYKVIQGNPDSPTFKNDIFSSDTVVLSKEELRSILIDNKYFFNK
jgi:UDP-N-acetylglucosamine 4,6-dehydratase